MKRAPKLNVVAVDELFCPNHCVFVVSADECPGRGDMAIIAGRKGSVLVHLGGCNSADEIHSLMCAAVSACLARRIRSSRLMPRGRALGLFSQALCMIFEALIQWPLLLETASLHDALLSQFW
jgi:hypothetical protein